MPIFFDLFDIDYSPTGSDNRAKEEDTVMHLLDLFEKCASGGIYNVLYNTF